MTPALHTHFINVIDLTWSETVKLAEYHK